MKRGAVLVDVSIDQGGCFETSRPTTHADPTFEVDGIIHYCVANMPGAVPVTSAQALNNATLPFVIKLADKGVAAFDRRPAPCRRTECPRRTDHASGGRRFARLRRRRQGQGSPRRGLVDSGATVFPDASPRVRCRSGSPPERTGIFLLAHAQGRHQLALVSAAARGCPSGSRTMYVPPPLAPWYLPVPPVIL